MSRWVCDVMWVAWLVGVWGVGAGLCEWGVGGVVNMVLGCEV